MSESWYFCVPGQYLLGTWYGTLKNGTYTKKLVRLTSLPGGSLFKRCQQRNYIGGDKKIIATDKSFFDNCRV